MNRVMLLWGLVLLSFPVAAQRQDMACYLQWQDGSDQVVTGTVDNSHGLRSNQLNRYAEQEYFQRYATNEKFTSRHGALQAIDCVPMGTRFRDLRANELYRLTPR